jgi:uncharacterized protein (DUF58 family)
MPAPRPRYIGDLFLTRRFYGVMAASAGLFILSYFLPLLFTPVSFMVPAILLFCLADYYLLFFSGGKIRGERAMPQRLSLGDDNPIRIRFENTYSFTTDIVLIDELPVQFQERNWRRRFRIGLRGRQEITYQLRPLTRGTYTFGDLLIYATSPLGLMQRRFRAAGETEVKVYPSFLHLRRYQLMAQADNSMVGAHKVRRLGHSLEFEKIKSYVQGDDVRSINWKASARSGDLMVNTYTDARQQLIYCYIDKGRAMKMPFDGLTLLDYSINAALALLNVAQLRQDKAGLLTFANKVNDVVAADRRSGQLNLLLEALYKQDTAFQESDYEALWFATHRRITQRAFILLFTNFETMSALERQLPYLRSMAKQHLLCVVFFENTLLRQIHETHPDTVEGIYIKTIAERFSFEKRQIVKELRRHGILSILTTPQNLSVDVINKYLELKARQMI